jgi:hypothetical protein
MPLSLPLASFPDDDTIRRSEIGSLKQIVKQPKNNSLIFFIHIPVGPAGA